MKVDEILGLSRRSCSDSGQIEVISTGQGLSQEFPSIAYGHQKSGENDDVLELIAEKSHGFQIVHYPSFIPNLLVYFRSDSFPRGLSKFGKLGRPLPCVQSTISTIIKLILNPVLGYEEFILRSNRGLKLIPIAGFPSNEGDS
jgi:hypothetical protein